MTLSDTRFFEPEIEQLGRDELQRMQFHLFKTELERVNKTCRFFRRHFESHGVKPDEVQEPSDIQKLPVVRKEDILEDMHQHPPFGSRLSVDPSAIVNIVETSGTSGRGREIQALTSTDYGEVKRAEAFGFYWAGVRPGTVVSMFMPVTMSAAGVWWLGALELLKANTLRLGHMSTEERLEYMKRFSVEVAIASAPYLMRMESVAQELGLDLRRDFPRLRSVFCFGGWTVDWAMERQERWGIKFFEQYGSSQRAIAWTCEAGMLHGDRPGVIHSLPHLSLLEVIDPESGQHVDAGEVGEIVITPFRQTGTPLIRYATGDFGRFMPPDACTCGRQFYGLEAGSIGRYDDMMKIKGVNVWPSEIDKVVFSESMVADYRGTLEVDDRGREIAIISVKFERSTEETDRDQKLRAIAEAVHKRVGVRFEVREADDVAMAPTNENLKIRRWQDQRIKR